MPEQVPKGWGKDKLSAFAEGAIHNEMATYAHPNTAGWHDTMNRLAVSLTKCSEKVLVGVTSHYDAIARMLFLQAHSQYLGAARAASSGHCIVAYPVGRAAIESAFYAWYLISDLSAVARWLDKPAGHKEKRQWSSEFSVSSIAAKFAAISADAANAAEWGKFLHQSAIDEGAHPNEQALFGNMQVSDEDGQFRSTFLHGHGLQFVNAAKFAIETGMFVLRMFEFALPAVAEELGVGAQNQSITRMLTLMINNSAGLIAEAERRLPPE